MFLYIVYKCGDIRSSNTGDYEVTNCKFPHDRQKLSFSAKYLRKYWTDLDQIFRFGRHMGGDG